VANVLQLPLSNKNVIRTKRQLKDPRLEALAGPLPLPLKASSEGRPHTRVSVSPPQTICARATAAATPTHMLQAPLARRALLSRRLPLTGRRIELGSLMLPRFYRMFA